MSEDDDKSETRKLETVENDDDDDNAMTGDDQEVDDVEDEKDDEDKEESNMDVDDDDGDADTQNHDEVEEKEKEEEDDDDDSGDEDQDLEEKLTENYTSTIRTKKQRYHTPKIFQDAITVLIPLDVTADLKIAMKKTRAKRISSIYKKYPSLKKETKKLDDKNNLKDDDEPMLDDEEEENAKEKDDKQPQSKKKKMENVPQPDQFGSVLDYLEAKYVKGVMLDEDDEDGAPIGLDDKSEGQGSVYSRDSFLDDTDLQRDVAEQVMASTTLTKLELEHEDGDFFVNVGTLEVENDDYGDNYDPLQDKENTGKTKAKTTKKRKKSSSAVSTTSAKSSKSSKSSKVTTSTSTTTPASTKSKKAKTEQQKKKKQQPQQPTSAAKSTKSIKSTVSTASTAKSKKTVEKKGDKVAKLAAKKAKSHSDALFKKAAGMIRKLTSEELPKRTTKRKVALKCPKNKKPGDDITFTNPHNPGQKLRVKIPKECFPGGTFKVTVPVKHQKGEDEKDRNKLSRELQESLDVYGKAFDEYCTAQSKIDSSFETFKEKQGKFIKVANMFPSDLITPIDSDYLKQVVRRARQNKYKRSKTAAKNTAIIKQEVETAEDDPNENDDEDVDDDEVEDEDEDADADEDVEEDDAEEEEEEEEEEDDQPEPKKCRIVDIPTTGTNYPSKTWSLADFDVDK